MSYNHGLIQNSANDGLLTSVTGSDGRSLQLGYDPSLRLDTLTDATGTVYHYGYDATGHLAGVSAPSRSNPSLTATRHYLYNEAAFTANTDLPDALTGIVDEADQRFATFSYQADGRAIATEHAGGVERVAVTYHPDGSAQISLPTGAIQTRTFVAPNGVSRTASVSESGAGVVHNTGFTFDANGRTDLSTDFSGTQTDYDFDARGLLVQHIDSANQPATRRTRQTDWDATFAVPLETRTYDSSTALPGTLLSRTTQTLNARGQVLSRTQWDPKGVDPSRTTTFTYCEAADVEAGRCPRVGLLTQMNEARTDVADLTELTYYLSDDPSCASAPSTCPHRAGDRWTLRNAANQTITFLRYDGAGRVRAVQDPTGVITELSYSPRGELTTRIVRGNDDSRQSEDAITQLSYDANGQLIQLAQADGILTHFAYDAAHRLTEITDGEGNVY